MPGGCCILPGRSSGTFCNDCAVKGVEPVRLELFLSLEKGVGNAGLELACSPWLGTLGVLKGIFLLVGVGAGVVSRFLLREDLGVDITM